MSAVQTASTLVFGIPLPHALTLLQCHRHCRPNPMLRPALKSHGIWSLGSKRCSAAIRAYLLVEQNTLHMAEP
ncbi:hypothetical protein BS47DRAFT_945116 [Hydnum rufescens UP504]|uniref:Uncharacterized protein n=1 Tax=Hydnum rufescens UP504 TaxID=1448309 RepID=A0A9P6AX97_9AGAM|nr:hypothetical protein BS47DRAFT_945116 [Hydnum rufescens UP504]